MSFPMRLFASLVALGLASCGDAVGEPITTQNPDSGGNNVGCTAPQPPLACMGTQDCSNYPSTHCGPTGFCTCSSSDAGSQTADAGGPDARCTPPQVPLACMGTQDCGNYPTTVCGPTGFCVCP
jgi:hypothetical protein